MEVDSNRDEIKAHISGRYLSPPEAAWHIYAFRSHEEFPAVTRLAVHLPDEQPVYFDEDASPEEIRDTMENTGSTLLAFFDYNARNPDGRRYPRPLGRYLGCDPGRPVRAARAAHLLPTGRGGPGSRRRGAVSRTGGGTARRWTRLRD